MNIELQVTGGTVTTVRCNVLISAKITGSLQIERSDFTKICDLFYSDGYTVTGNGFANVTAP